MRRLGLNADERTAYHRALRSSQQRRIRVAVLDLDGRQVGNISNRILDGQIVVDANATVTRMAMLQILDPRRTLDFDSNTPDDGALFADRMLRIHYSVFVAELDQWVSCPVFTGPVIKLDRNGDILAVEAHGKEHLAMGEMWRPLHLEKGTKKTDAIRTILERTGETRFDIPDLKVRLPKPQSLGRFAVPWKVARKKANGMDRQLFYPGDGVCTLRRRPTTPVFTFTEGEDGEVVGDVAVSHTLDDLKNVVLVRGGKPKGAKRRVQAVAIADPSEPLSPNPDRGLGRNGQQRYLVHRIDEDSIKSKREAQRKADRVLEDKLRQTVDVTFDSMPIPHLDAGDLVRVRTDEATWTFRLDRFTLPLGVEGDQTMAVGYLKKTGIDRRRIRR